LVSLLSWSIATQAKRTLEVTDERTAGGMELHADRWRPYWVEN
jgi:hypothetical protein